MTSSEMSAPGLDNDGEPPSPDELMYHMERRSWTYNDDAENTLEYVALTDDFRHQQSEDDRAYDRLQLIRDEVRQQEARDTYQQRQEAQARLQAEASAQPEGVKRRLGRTLLRIMGFGGSR